MEEKSSVLDPITERPGEKSIPMTCLSAIVEFETPGAKVHFDVGDLTAKNAGDVAAVIKAFRKALRKALLH